MIISLIVAAANNGAIGLNNDLPWRLPADLRHFKTLTTGHHILMGRKTYESIGRPLPNRTSVVITRNANFEAEGCKVVHSLSEAIQVAKQTPENEAFLIGGAQLYELALAEKVIDKIYLTEVDTEVEGDAFFPKLETAEWKELSRVHHVANEKNPFAYSFVELLRLVK